MGSRDYFKKGDWNAICDICGFKFKGSELRKRWDGFMVCKDDWEPRPAQEFIRGIKETFSTPYSRPESPDQFIVTGDSDSFALNTRAINSFPIDGISSHLAEWDNGLSIWDNGLSVWLE